MSGAAPPLTRQQRRRAEKLAGQVDVVLEGDRRFFGRHSDRAYRVRRAALVELEAASAVGITVGSSPGFDWYVAVRQFASGVRARIFFGGPAGNETDLAEWQAKFLYEREVAAQPVAQRVDRQFAAMADAKRGGGA